MIGISDIRRLLADFLLAAANLRAQKTRTFLTALGIIFGVGSVIGMLAIGAGAREESLRFIEQLGVRNVLVDSRPASSREELQQRRRSSPGLTERDVRILQANIEPLELVSARRTLYPAQILPKPSREMPELLGVRPSFAAIHNLVPVEGTFFREEDDLASAAVCVLGLNAKVNLLGYGAAVGRFIKVNDTWLEVVGVLDERIGGSGQSARGKMEDPNNRIYIPLNTFQYRYWDQNSAMKDDIDGIDIRLKAEADSVEVARIVAAILNSTHNNTEDFMVTIPAALLAQQKRTQTIFTYVMVAIAAISLLVGGIGIMNIMLASVTERTREIGIRRAIGAKRRQIVGQFLIETMVLSMLGGLVGVILGLAIPLGVTWLAQMPTVVTAWSVMLSLTIAAGVGIGFGLYPAVRAANLDPIVALRHE
jgi:putative ABC transport system permease protein